MTSGDRFWTQVGNLPLPAAGIRGASINNKIVMTGDVDNNVSYSNFTSGGYYIDANGRRHFSDLILKFDPIFNNWEIVDHMNIKRHYHAVDLVPISDIVDYCF